MPKRRLVHISMVLFALVIGRWPPFWVAASALAALLFNLFILPSLRNLDIRRRSHAALRYDPGLISYPLSVFLLSLIFWKQQIFLAVGWGALAFGDAAAQWVGQSFGRHPVPWNRNKTLEGSFAFLFAGTLLSWSLIALLPASAYPAGLTLQNWWLVLLMTMAVSALAETLPGTIDDNLWVPLVAAGSAWLGVQVFQEHVPAGLRDDWSIGAGIILVFMVLSFLSRKIDLPGTLMGGILAILTFLGGGWAGLGGIFLLFLLGTVASSWGKGKKEQLGIAQEQAGKRSARHAFSNAGVAGLLGLAAILLPSDQPLCLIGIIASLASATSDTFSSEFGSLYGRRTWNILSGRQGRRGDDGNVSIEGTLAGLVGGLFVGLSCGVVADLSAAEMGLIILAATLANLTDSLLGASCQKWDLMTNDSVNFASTAAGAMLAMIGSLLIA